MTERAEFKPCPFCGGNPHLQLYQNGFTPPDDSWRVECRCGAGVGASESEQEDAIERWNHRALQDERDGGWLPIEEINVKKGERFYAAEPDGDGWVVGIAVWCKTPHVPLYGFHFTEGDPENWNMCKPTFWRPLPSPPHIFTPDQITENLNERHEAGERV